MTSTQNPDSQQIVSLGELRLVLFRLVIGGTEYSFAVNTDKVREVIELSSLSPLPDSYRPYIGVLDLRGVPIPTISIESLFEEGKCASASNESNRVIICESGGRLTGLLVNRWVKIRVFEQADLFSPDFQSMGVGSQETIQCVVRESDGSFIYMLHLDGILSSLSEATP